MPRPHGGRDSLDPFARRSSPNDFIIAAKADGAYTLRLVGSEGEMRKDESLPHLEDIPRFRNIIHRRVDLP